MNYHSQQKAMALNGWKPLDQDGLVSFYEALFASESGQSEILTASLYSDDAHPHEFQSYSNSYRDDIIYLIEDIARKPYVIYTGIFRPITRKNGSLFFTARTNTLSWLTCFCIDIDAPAGGLFVDPAPILEKIAHTPKVLSPTYISLSGHGLHLWYPFDTHIQTFGPRSRRRWRLNTLIQALYSYWDQTINEDEGKIDFACANLVHGFRAPGTLTKDNDTVMCFTHANAPKSAHPLDMTNYLFDLGFLNGGTDNAALLDKSDLVWVDYGFLQPPEATKKQCALIAELALEGSIDKSIADKAQQGTLSTSDAWHAINTALSVPHTAKLPYHAIQDRTSWRTRPHPLNTDAIYNMLLSEITRTQPGRRYSALYMLAGVAYMTQNPTISPKRLQADMERLINSSWGHAHSTDHKPLTKDDVKKALGGYKEDNRQTRKMIVSTLGFDPFAPSAKRNGRTRAEHLAQVHVARKGATMQKVVAVLKESPTLSKAELARQAGLSYQTVCAHWQDACAELGISPTRRRGRPKIKTD